MAEYEHVSVDLELSAEALETLSKIVEDATNGAEVEGFDSSTGKIEVTLPVNAKANLVVNGKPVSIPITRSGIVMGFDIGRS